MRAHPISLIYMLTSIWKHRRLTWVMSKREVIGRYKGSIMGLLWSFFNPLLMLAVYTFFFTEVFQARWKQGSESHGEFAIALFAGLMIHNFFAECATKSPITMIGNANYVKKIVFPLEQLPLIGMFSALFHFLVSMVVLVVFEIIFFGKIPATFILFPVVVIPLLAVSCGVCWLLSALGVFLRDLQQSVGIIVILMMYTSPLFFPPEMMPEKFRLLLALNPLTLLMNEARAVMIWGDVPDMAALSRYTVIAVVFAWLCFMVFQKTRKGFADVL